MVLIDPDAVLDQTKIRRKGPKRVLHFSDGTLEEYSTEEEDEVDSADKDKTVVDPATLTWGPWFWYKTMVAGSSTLSYLDMAGEFLAGFFGITTPRYYFEMEEYKKREAEVQSNKDLEQGWSEPSTGAPLNDSTSKGVATKQPEPVAV